MTHFSECLRGCGWEGEWGWQKPELPRPPELTHRPGLIPALQQRHRRENHDCSPKYK